ncbi:hypothetical protein AUC45_06900 [Erythrobacter sp. YT30]|nr:hypothetical protein AUC45_06900 [Erythrobacter sp. YT30]
MHILETLKPSLPLTKQVSGYDACGSVTVDIPIEGTFCDVVETVTQLYEKRETFDGELMLRLNESLSRPPNTAILVSRQYDDWSSMASDFKQQIQSVSTLFSIFCGGRAVEYVRYRELRYWIAASDMKAQSGHEKFKAIYEICRIYPLQAAFIHHPVRG